MTPAPGGPLLGSSDELGGSGALPVSHVTLADKLLLFLEQNPGQPLCGSCIAKALSVPAKRVYSAISLTEGRGGRRFHAKCSVCAKSRLVAMRSTGSIGAT